MRSRVFGWIFSNPAAAALSIRGSNERIEACRSSSVTNRPMLTSQESVKNKGRGEAKCGHVSHP
jgi:hypothetical protein